MTLDAIRFDLAHGAPRRLVNESLARFAATVPEDAFVLEIGCGHYDHRPYFRNLRRLDIDPGYGPDVIGDALRLPLADDSVDASISISVIEHVHDPYQMVREWHRVLKPGGRAFAWVPFFFGVHGYPGDISRFTEEGVRQLFERAGFDVVAIDSRRYAGLFLNITDAVHFVLPRRHRSRLISWLNRVLVLLGRLAFPLDRRFRLRTLYAGKDVEVVKR